MGACVVNGIGAGPAETIMPAVIADIFFLHDRGKWNTLYWVVYMGSLMVRSVQHPFGMVFTDRMPGVSHHIRCYG
jgi:hypothetical protein